MIRDKVRTPDVFISADPLVNEQVLMGPQNGSLVKWFVVVASSALVLAYSPRSKFAAKFEEARSGKLPWYEVLQTPHLRFGRGDPSIDPKGYRTLFLFDLAATFHHRPELPGLLGLPMNPAQVFPEVVLLARLESGQCDGGIFYRHEVVAHKLPYLTLPPEIDLGDPRLAARYAEASYTPSTGGRVGGAPILFTITIPETVRSRAAALAFVRFILSSDKLLGQFGFGQVAHQVGGDGALLPLELRSLVQGSFRP